MVGKLKLQLGEIGKRSKDEDIKFQQSTNDLDVLFLSASRAQKKLHEFTDTIFGKDTVVHGAAIVKSHGCRIQMKNLWRAMEKITFEKDKAKRDQAETLLDVARDGVSFKDYRGIGEGIEALCRSPKISMVRIKDRISNPEFPFILKKLK